MCRECVCVFEESVIMCVCVCEESVFVYLKRECDYVCVCV